MVLTETERTRIQDSVQYYPDHDDPVFFTVEFIVRARENALRAKIAEEVLNMGTETHSHVGLGIEMAQKVAVRILRGSDSAAEKIDNQPN